MSDLCGMFCFLCIVLIMLFPKIAGTVFSILFKDKEGIRESGNLCEKDNYNSIWFK